MIWDFKRILGDESKTLRKPVLLLSLDTIFNMVFYGMLYAVLIDLINEEFNMGKIKTYTLIMVVAFIMRSFINSKGYTMIQIRGARLIEKMRISLGDHVRNLNLGYFNKNSIGTLTNIMTNDLQDFEQIITHSTSDLIKTMFLSVYLILITFAIDRQLALIQACVMISAMPIVYIGGRRMAKIGSAKKEVMNHMISRMVEYLSGIQVFKAYSLVGDKFERLETSFQDFKRECIRTEVSIVPYVMIFQVVVDLSFPVLLLVAASRFGAGTIGRQAFLTFIIINISLTNVLRAFGAQYGVFRYFRLAMKRLESTYAKKQMPYQKEEVTFENYDVEFENVDFEYENGEQTIKDMSFTAKEGSMTALIGPSGSGKTTVTSLIARFWDVKSGCIKIGGVDISTIKPDCLLENISMVFQDVYLINDTVYNNIRLGHTDASEEDVKKVAKLANCHNFIEKMDEKYDTVIGEGGCTLSGGEKQRISIARAMLKDAPVVLLDEATASLDADNEYEIRKSIDRLTRGKTIIVIAHRLNTIRDADQIIVLNEGEIEEIGSHDELIENKKRYFDMYSEMENAKEWVVA